MSRFLISDPHIGSSKFIIGSGGSGELRLYDWDHSKSTSTIKTLATISELGQARTFAWSASPSIPDLISIGLTNGKVILLRANSYSSISASPESTSKLSSSVQISPRHSRPCNVVTFAHDQPLLAVGLEKGRGESLLLFDIESHSRSLVTGLNSNSNIPSRPKAYVLQSQDASSNNTPIMSSPPPGNLNSTSSTNEPKPLLQFGSSESVSSASFLTPGTISSSPLLVAGMGGKFIRTYDVRTSSVAVQWASRSLLGLVSNPFDSHQFSSYGEDGVIKLFDIRFPTDSLLSFSEHEAGSIPNKIRSNLSSNKPLIDMVWCPTKRGVLATLEKESNTVRVWQLVDGCKAKVISKSELNSSTSNGISSKDELKLPTLLGDQRTRPFQHALSSFAFASSPNSSTLSSINIVGVSRDGSSPGTSGHRIEIVELLSPQHFGFLERSLVLAIPSNNINKFSTVTISPTPINSNINVTSGGSGEEEGQMDSNPGSHNSVLLGTSTGSNLPGGRGRSLSLSSVYIPTSSLTTAGGSRITETERRRNETPRPSGSITPRNISRSRLEEEPLAINSLGYGGLSALGRDPAVLLREWVDRGYGSNPALNASLVDSSSIREFWTWIARAEIMTQDACLLDYDFRYRGVLSILQGFPKSSATLTPEASLTPTSSTSNSIYSDIHRSLRKGDEVRAKDAAYSAAAIALVSRRNLSSFPIFSNFSAQRKLALQTCGADWEESFDVVCLRFQRREDFEGAARFCFLNGNLDATIKYLRSCKSDKLRLITPVLAAYISQKDAAKGTDSVYSELCRSLGSDLDTPWIRAMFAFLASGEWRDVVDESGLPLKDRVAVALRFLSDHELLPFLVELGTESMASGDLDAVLLYGLRSTGFNLLQSYLNRTADIQSVAIATSFVCPGLIRGDLRLERWIQTYRNLLDRLKLYTSRALFDSARGRRGRILLEQVKNAGRVNEATEVGKALRALAPPQILVRCQFCSTNVSVAGGEKNGLVVGKRVVQCPTCLKKLPSCCICLTKPSILADGGSLQSQIMCWCSLCKHGGHVDHILSWFERSEVCAVSNCDCKCSRDL